MRTVGLVKGYGATEAQCGIDLVIPEGAIHGPFGPNGSGKTTALETVAGLRRPSADRIELGVAPDRVAYCPDMGGFEPWLSATEVLDVAAALLDGRLDRPRSVPRSERVGRAAASGGECVRAWTWPPG